LEAFDEEADEVKAVGKYTLRSAEDSAIYNSTMDHKELAKQLEGEGYSHTYIWQDPPNAFYPEHTHGAETAHIILSGEMTLTMNGCSEMYTPGSRCDVPAGTVHSARVGPKGCRYLIGER
jgi:mannose-6-phosphate isomerase-like protein (cupin superfamily)